MKKKQIRNSLLLVLTALVWGIAFVAQSTGGDAIGPYSFNSIRSIIGSLVLIPVIFLLDRINPSGKRPKTKEEKKGRCFWAASAAELFCFWRLLRSNYWHLLRNLCRKGGLSDSLLYFARSGFWPVFKEKMWHQYLDRYCHRDRRALSALHERFHFLPDKRSDGAALCGFYLRCTFWWSIIFHRWWTASGCPVSSFWYAGSGAVSQWYFPI